MVIFYSFEITILDTNRCIKSPALTERAVRVETAEPERIDRNKLQFSHPWNVRDYCTILDHQFKAHF